MASRPEEILRQVFEVFATGDREATAGFFAEDAVFRYPGPGPLHGEYRGRAGVMRFWALQDEIWSGAFRPEMVDLVGSETRAFLLVRFHPDDGEPWLRVVVYDIEGVEITGATVFEHGATFASSQGPEGGMEG